MTGALVSVTLGALLSRRRTLLLGLLGLLLVGIAVLLRLASPADPVAATERLLADFGLRVLVPLVAVIVGTAALGSELDDGTIVYLLAKPIPRWRIVLVKLAMAWLVTALLVAPAVLIGGIVAQGDGTLAVPFAVASVVAALEYTAVFVALSLVTGRALIIGLAYVLVWEGVVAGLFEGTRILSIRQHALAVAEALGATGLDGDLATGVALVAVAVVTAGAGVLAVRRLQRVELRGETG